MKRASLAILMTLLCLGRAVLADPPPPGCFEDNWTAPVVNDDGSALAPGELVGFRLYYGASSSVLSRTHDVSDGTVRSARVCNLSAGVYYVAITARTAREESDLSDAASAVVTGETPPPSPTPIPTPAPTPAPTPGAALVISCPIESRSGISSTSTYCVNDVPTGCLEAPIWIAADPNIRVRADDEAVEQWPHMRDLKADDLVEISKTAATGAPAKCSQITGRMTAAALLETPPPAPAPAPTPTPTPVPTPPPSAAIELCLVDGIAAGTRPIYQESTTHTRGAKVGDLIVGLVSQPAGTSNPIRRADCSCTDLKNWSGTVYARAGAGYVAGCKSYGVR